MDLLQDCDSLVQPIVQGSSLFTVTGKDTCEYTREKPQQQKTPPRKNCVAIPLMLIIIMVISVVPDLTDKSEHTVLYKINNNVYIKTSKMINYIVIILYSLQIHTHTHTHTHSHTHTHTHTHTCMHACTHTHTQCTHMHIGTHTHTHTHIHTCVRAHMHTCTHTRTHTHTHKLTLGINQAG